MILRRTRCAWIAIPLLLVLGTRVASSDASDDSSGFFFVHVSDVHAVRHASEVAEHYGVGPRWLPNVLRANLAVQGYEDELVPNYADAIVPHLRRAIGFDPVATSAPEWWDSWTYFNELLEPGSELGNVEDDLRAAFAEVHGLGPAFIINTGDIVFDSGRVPPDVSARWMALYKEASAAGSAPIHHTIGNHELGSIKRGGASTDDPFYGRRFFEHHFRPIPYSFDRGEFHFVALDTHSPDPSGEGWRFNRMRPEVKAWLEADLARERDRSVVLINHEPLYQDALWTVDEDFAATQLVDDEGLLERFAVPYTLSGHIHLPGSAREGMTTHIATGSISGMHWVLPPSAAPRGYRLFYARGRQLF
jgi:Icc protein